VVEANVDGYENVNKNSDIKEGELVLASLEITVAQFQAREVLAFAYLHKPPSNRRYPPSSGVGSTIPKGTRLNLLADWQR